jgi:hypothetical protein
LSSEQDEIRFYSFAIIFEVGKVEILRFEIRLSEDLTGDALETLQDQLAEWLRLRDFHGSVCSCETQNIVQIEDEERSLQMRFEDLLGVEVRYPASLWEERSKRVGGER